MSTSGQFLTVPPMTHRSPQYRRRDSSARDAAQSPRARHFAPGAVGGRASSSRVKLEDTPLGIPVSSSSSPSTSTSTSHPDTDTSTTARTSSSSSSRSFPPSSYTYQATPPSPSPSPSAADPPLPSPGEGAAAAAAAAAAASTMLPSPSGATATSDAPKPSPPPLSPRSLLRAMPFLLRLRSPPSDLLNLTYSSGGRRTHPAVSRSRMSGKAPQALTYNKTLVCADAVNAEVLLRLARNELLKRAQAVNRHVTALVDEEWRYTIRQTKSGDYNVQVFYSACPAMCENQNSNVPVDPRKPVALSHVRNIPGLMRVVHSE